jgi:hypothetical protein
MDLTGWYNSRLDSYNLSYLKVENSDDFFGLRQTDLSPQLERCLEIANKCVDGQITLSDLEDDFADAALNVDERNLVRQVHHQHASHTGDGSILVNSVNLIRALLDTLQFDTLGYQFRCDEKLTFIYDSPSGLNSPGLKLVADIALAGVEHNCTQRLVLLVVDAERYRGLETDQNADAIKALALAYSAFENNRIVNCETSIVESQTIHVVLYGPGMKVKFFKTQLDIPFRDCVQSIRYGLSGNVPITRVYELATPSHGDTEDGTSIITWLFKSFAHLKASLYKYEEALWSDCESTDIALKRELESVERASKARKLLSVVVHDHQLHAGEGGKPTDAVGGAAGGESSSFPDD